MRWTPIKRAHFAEAKYAPLMESHKLMDLMGFIKIVKAVLTIMRSKSAL
jgi:hypothetical protein